MIFRLLLPVISRVSSTWDDQAEQLRGGHKRLNDAHDAVDALGDRVGPVARTYVTTWLTEVTNLATAAQGRSDGLAEFTHDTVELDQAAADDLRAILPWDDRHAVRPFPGFPVPGNPLMTPLPGPGLE